jgi:hypothetical protein
VCPSCGAKRAVKFAEHIYNEVIEDVPHRHTVFTIPKRLRVFFKYDRKLNSILLRAAWGALSQVLGISGERELAAIFTVQTAGEALNYHPHLHGLLADGYWKDGVFTRFSKVALEHPPNMPTTKNQLITKNRSIFLFLMRGKLLSSFHLLHSDLSTC